MALTSTPAGLKCENEMKTLCLAAGDRGEGVVAFRPRRDAGLRR
jgi:hypothetical protein